MITGSRKGTSHQTRMRTNRDLLDIRNLGEFAFTMAAMGLILALIAFVVAFFALELVGIKGRPYLVLLTIAIWILMNLPVYRALHRRALLWSGEQRASKQIGYVEWTSVAMLVLLALLGGNAVGTRELIRVLEYLFSAWLLSLLTYQVLLHYVMRYKIHTRDAVKWVAMFIYTTVNLYAKSS